MKLYDHLSGLTNTSVVVINLYIYVMEYKFYWTHVYVCSTRKVCTLHDLSPHHSAECHTLVFCTSIIILFIHSFYCSSTHFHTRNHVLSRLVLICLSFLQDTVVKWCCIRFYIPYSTYFIVVMGLITGTVYYSWPITFSEGLLTYIDHNSLSSLHVVEQGISTTLDKWSVW